MGSLWGTLGPFLAGTALGATVGIITYAIVVVGASAEREADSYMRGRRSAFEEMRRSKRGE